MFYLQGAGLQSRLVRLCSSFELLLLPLSEEDGRESDGIAVGCAIFGGDVEAISQRDLRALVTLRAK